ncbi:MAG: cyclophilin-like fold protein [Burkholderiaceae bacterium]
MTRIRVIVDNQILPATLDDSPAARDFASMLPLELTLTDYHGIEKVADLGRKLDATDAPGSYTPAAGDITQYRPWANLAIFLKPFRDSAGLLRLGRFDRSIDALRRDGEIRVRIERVD